MREEIERALIVLYRDILDPDELDLAQLGTDAQVDAWRNAETAAVLDDLKAAVDLDKRGDRYAAALAYVLAVRRSKIQPSLPSIEQQIAALGEALLERYEAPPSGEADLRNALARLIDQPEISDEVGEFLLSAFGDALSVTDNGDGTLSFTGAAAEMATMLTELSSMQMACEAHNGTVEVNGVRHKVLSLRFEVCTQLPFDRSAKAIDPRRWPTFSPLFFQSVTLVDGVATSTGPWYGTIQESVGALTTGTPIVTNLLVSYHEEAGLAVTAYDLSQDPMLLADDGTVKVDYGYFSVTEEGLHRRVSVMKVVSIEGKEDTPPHYLCPLWLQQFGMIGWSAP
ncbi:MAG: hypothetical protein QOF21_1532 [Actinomycetota bacterium]|jgi:hypothetical protein